MNGTDKATITVNISPEVADRAKEAGILTGEKLEKLILAELECKEKARLFIEDIKAIAAVEPPISMEEIEAYHATQ